MANLASLRADSATALGQLMRTFAPAAERHVLLEQYDDVAHHLFTIAVATLLVDGESSKFILNLVRCAENGVRFLALFRKRRVGLPPASRNIPLLAALAAGDFQRAAQQAALARRDLAIADCEYESERLWARVIQLLAEAETPDAAQVSAVLKALETCEGGDAFTDQAALIVPLLEQDRAAFETALVAAQATHERRIEERARAFATPVTRFAPHRFIWLEGLALLKLAERANIGGVRNLV